METIDLLNKVSEMSGEDRSADMGAGGGMTQAGAQTGATGTSWRDQAIANLPPATVMQQQIRKHIEKEVKKLRGDVRRAAGRAGAPGMAFKLNELYARIRRLNALLAEILESSYDVLRRIFIRVFIDKQTVV